MKETRENSAIAYLRVSKLETGLLGPGGMSIGRVRVELVESKLDGFDMDGGRPKRRSVGLTVL